MANVLAADKQCFALQMLCEGSSLRSITRLTGIHRTTVMKLLVRFGDACRQFLDEEMRGLTLRHIQCDEIWTFVAKKRASLHVDERDNPHIGDIYLWTCLDTETKLLPTFVIGKRSGDMARRMMMDLASRLNMPRPQDWNTPTFDKVVQISTDSFIAYPEAVDMAFGPYVRYGTIEKDFRNKSPRPGTYAPAEMVRAKRKARFGMSEDEMDKICTSHVERNNLTIRTFMKRFARLTLGFSKKLENLAAATAIHMAYYNFVWRPVTLKGSTPAMAANVTNRLWSFDMLFSEVTARYLQD